MNDPLERVLGVFNTPVGAGYLDSAGQYRLSQLSRLRNRFMTTRTPQQRESLFKSAVALKKNLQSQISNEVDRYGRKQAEDWKAANDDVDRMIREADHVKDDPGKRYELIARQLHTSNPGSGEDPFEERRILAFTQRMQDDPALRDKLSQWHFEAAGKLNSYDVGGPKRYEDILKSLPAAGPDYVRDLADRYDTLLNDTTTRNHSITPEERATKVAGQILEGTARVLLGMTPFAPLSSAFDAHSTLSPSARIGIDLTANLLGMAIDPANAASAALDEAKLFAQAVKEIDAAAEVGSVARTAADAATAGRIAPFSMPASHIDAEQSITGRVMGIPAGYASEVDPGSLQPSASTRGMLEDGNGQSFVPIDGRAYPARYDKTFDTWRVFDPDNPWRPAYPVRLNANNEWVVHGDVGLRGGMMDASAASSPAMSPELKTALEVKDWKSATNTALDDPAYRQAYKAAFEKLPADQQRAIRQWTAVDNGSDSGSGSDSSSGSDSESGSDSGNGSAAAAGSKNYELNKALYTHTPYDGIDKDVSDLIGGLDGLPAPPKQQAHLLRVADVPADYATRFKPGDLITNSPAFMSASSGNEYATYALWDQAAIAGTDHPALAFYDIEARSAKPFLDGIATDASAEREWLFRPNTVFKVKEIGVLPASGPDEKPRVGMRLVEVPVTAALEAKNIYTGQTVKVSPGGPAVEEIVAGPSPAKKQKTG
ncbi:hypothetical protein [Paraburkholderia solisilvae]|nr:hypothetical protein [Paraburkholderia solisilvae]